MKKIIGSLVLAVCLLIPTSSFAAMTTTQMEALIASLQAQIAALQAVQGGGSIGGTGGSTCINLTHNLYFGLTDASTGGDVSSLQKFLGGQITGFFGPATEQLVQKWQAAHGVVTSGTPDTTGYGAVGPTTRAKMAAGCTTMSPFVPLPLDSTSTGEASISVTGIASSTIYASYTNLPADSQIWIVKASNGKRYTAQSTMVENGGSGSVAVPIPNALTKGTYRLRVSNYNDPTEIVATSEKFSITKEEDSDASVTLLSVSGTMVTAAYTNAMSYSEIDVVNKATGVVVGIYDIREGGNGTAVLYLNTNEIATGTYYLQLAGGGKPWPSSSSFALTGTAPVCSISTGKSNGANVITWSSSGATSATSDLSYAKTGSYDPIATNGSLTFGDLSSPTVFSFWFKGPGGQSTCVSKIIEPSVSITYGGPSATFDASSLYSTSNHPTITGSVKAGVSTVELALKSYTGGTAKVKNGRWSITIADTLPSGTYALQLLNGADDSILGTATLMVSVSQSPTISFSASPSSITAGQSTALIWYSSGANRCILQHDSFQDDVFLSGSVTKKPTQTTTYYLNCTNDPGNGKDGPTAFAQTTVTVSSVVEGAVVNGVYEGTYPAGVTHSAGNHPEGTVTVNITGDGRGALVNRALVLTSYEPVNWVIKNPNGIGIPRIILIGYYASRVTGDVSGIIVDGHSIGSDGVWGYTYDGSPSGGGYPTLANWLNAKYPNNWVFSQGSYSASSLNIYVGYKG